MHRMQCRQWQRAASGHSMPPTGRAAPLIDHSRHAQREGRLGVAPYPSTLSGSRWLFHASHHTEEPLPHLL